MIRRLPLLIQTSYLPICLSRRCVQLQCEKPYEALADKIVRTKPNTIYYTHPSYVMAREKMLYTLWVDTGVFATTIYFLIPYFGLAFFFKA